jgi:hypothetical protein
MRVFPVPYRFLDPDKRFKKWQWIDVSVKRAAGDPRPESHNLDIASLKIVSNVSTAHEWAARRELVRPLRRPSLCAIMKEQQENDAPTLGIFRPGKIKRLTITADSPVWTHKQATILSQQLLGFEKGPKRELEKIPFEFRYEFICDDANCRGHKILCTDWEMAEAYRQWRAKYGANWEEKFRGKFERDMIEKYDTHFFVGTVHQHPRNWLIVGLFYPPKEKIKDLFG